MPEHIRKNDLENRRIRMIQSRQLGSQNFINKQFIGRCVIARHTASHVMIDNPVGYSRGLFDGF